MSVKLYMDVHVRRAITQGLRMRGVDVLTSQKDETAQLSDPELLDRAKILGRVLFTHDTDLLREAVRRQQKGEGFAGLVFAHQLRITVGQCVHDLELIAKTSDAEDFANWVEYLPLR